MRTSNPILSEKQFRGLQATGSEVMTQKGAYLKTGALLLLCVGAASFTWNPQGAQFMFPGIIGGLVFALITVFKKEWSPITAPLYAVCEGLALGGISYMYQNAYEGIVQNAIMLTFAVMAVMLFVYANGLVKVNDKFRSIIMVSTGAICLVYLVSFIMSFFGTSIPMIHGSGPIGIGFSLLVVGIASFNLLLDFDFIERASGRSPKYMEWFGAFGLMVTLVWLYIEMLRLLQKLQSRR